jgi:hypothetical protein
MQPRLDFTQMYQEGARPDARFLCGEQTLTSLFRVKRLATTGGRHPIVPRHAILKRPVRQNRPVANPSVILSSPPASRREQPWKIAQPLQPQLSSTLSHNVICRPRIAAICGLLLYLFLGPCGWQSMEGHRTRGQTQDRITRPTETVLNKPAALKFPKDSDQ